MNSEKNKTGFFVLKEGATYTHGLPPGAVLTQYGFSVTRESIALGEVTK